MISSLAYFELFWTKDDEILFTVFTKSHENMKKMYEISISSSILQKINEAMIVFVELNHKMHVLDIQDHSLQDSIRGYFTLQHKIGENLDEIVSFKNQHGYFVKFLLLLSLFFVRSSKIDHKNLLSVGEIIIFKIIHPSHSLPHFVYYAAMLQETPPSPRTCLLFVRKTVSMRPNWKEFFWKCFPKDLLLFLEKKSFF